MFSIFLWSWVVTPRSASIARKKRVNAWLWARDYPSMPLPSVCGYSPMMTRVYERLMKRGL